jgi:tetrahydromethanopterin S-methyltransferase subunit A
VEVIDLVGTADRGTILGAVAGFAGRTPGPAEPFEPERLVIPVSGYLSDRMIPDAAGYFVIYPDRRRQLLSVEHYRNDGLLDAVIEGRTAAEAYTPVIDKGLVSRLDHAAYLGRELARAERSLKTGEPYVQDAAPEMSVRHACGGGTSCDTPSP